MVKYDRLSDMAQQNTAADDAHTEDHCPECGAFTALQDDPMLPDTHANEVCTAGGCPQDLVTEGVPLAEDEQEAEDEDSDLIEISTDAEAADILCSNLTSADLRSWASSHGVRNYAGRAKRPTAEMCVTQQPEAVVQWLDEQDLVTPAEGLAEDLGGVDSLHEAQQHTGSDVLRSRLADLEDAVDEAGYEYRVTSLDMDPDGLTFVRISAPDHSWTNEGETHADRFWACLGENGGLRRLEVQDEFSGWETDYAENPNSATSAWTRFLDKVRNAEGGTQAGGA